MNEEDEAHADKIFLDLAQAHLTTQVTPYSLATVDFLQSSEHAMLSSSGPFYMLFSLLETLCSSPCLLVFPPHSCLLDSSVTSGTQQRPICSVQRPICNWGTVASSKVWDCWLPPTQIWGDCEKILVQSTLIPSQGVLTGVQQCEVKIQVMGKMWRKCKVRHT